MWRWSDVLQNDFASRADWCVKSYDEANHPPVVVLRNGLDMKVKSGETVNLSAKGTSDPDGDELTFTWWQYREAGTYNGNVTIKDAEKVNATFTVPVDAKGNTIHIICEVKDSGTPPLTRYKRIILRVTE